MEENILHLDDVLHKNEEPYQCWYACVILIVDDYLYLEDNYLLFEDDFLLNEDDFLRHEEKYQQTGLP